MPLHFHVTEIGQINKKFIDCGGTIREEKNINFQLWYSTDNDHRLEAEKLRKIINLSERKLDLGDHAHWATCSRKRKKVVQLLLTQFLAVFCDPG